MRELLTITEADWSWLEHIASVTTIGNVIGEFYRKALGMTIEEWTSEAFQINVLDYCVTKVTHDRLFDLLSRHEPNKRAVGLVWLDIGPAEE